MGKKDNNCNKLTHNHKLFCEKYLIMNNSTKAYMEVYKDVNEHVASVNACRLLKRQDIQEHIQSIRQKVYSDNLDTIENILIELRNIYKGNTKVKKIFKIKGEPKEIEVEATFSERLKAIEMYCKILGFSDIYELDDYYIKGDTFDGDHKNWV